MDDEAKGPQKTLIKPDFLRDDGSEREEGEESPSTFQQQKRRRIEKQ